MTFGAVFYLFALPVAIAVAGALIAYFVRSNSDHHLHPGE